MIRGVVKLYPSTDEIVPTHAPTNAVRTASMPFHVKSGAVPREPQHHGA